MKNEIIKEIENRGYKAELKTVTKNGVDLDAVVIGDGIVRPTMYLAEFTKGCGSVSEVADGIIKAYEEHKKPDINVEQVMSRDYIMKNIAIALQRCSSEDIIKKPTEYEGIEQYLLVDCGDFSYKLTSDVEKKIKIDIDKAWDAAMRNVETTTVLKPLCKMIAEETGLPEGVICDRNILVATNKRKFKGASAVLNKKALKKFADKIHEEKLYLLPSSIHDVIIIPETLAGAIEDLSNMVKSVNSENVDVMEQLSDMAYEIRF